MKTIFHISVLVVLLGVAASPCFAVQANTVVSMEQAKKLGVTIQCTAHGQHEVEVWLQFKPEGELTDFMHVDLEISAGGKTVVAAPLLASHPTPGSVSVIFYTDASYLAGSVLTIVVSAHIGSLGYQFKLKDFFLPEIAR